MSEASRVAGIPEGLVPLPAARIGWTHRLQFEKEKARIAAGCKLGSLDRIRTDDLRLERAAS